MKDKEKKNEEEEKVTIKLINRYGVKVGSSYGIERIRELRVPKLGRKYEYDSNLSDLAHLRKSTSEEEELIREFWLGRKIDELKETIKNKERIIEKYQEEYMLRYSLGGEFLTIQKWKNIEKYLTKYGQDGILK